MPLLKISRLFMKKRTTIMLTRMIMDITILVMNNGWLYCISMNVAIIVEQSLIV